MYIDELNQKYSTYNAFAKQQANQKNILSQNASKSPRKFNLRWLLTISSIPLFGIYAAFGLVPKTSPNDIHTSVIVEDVMLPAPQPLSTTDNKVFIYKEHVRRDDTLANVLTRLHINNPKAIKFIRNVTLDKVDNKKLKVGQTFEAAVDESGHLRVLDFQHTADEYVHIQQAKDGDYTAKSVKTPLDKRVVFKSATINHSLFASTDQADIPDEIATQIISIFESAIDFHKDIHKGDHFKVIYEASYNKGKLMSSGDILAIEFSNKNHEYMAIGFKNNQGEMEYYSPEGKSLNKSFLRSPLEFTRVTSGFSKGRFHPVLQRIRAHKGVDMAAPTGTRIRATGDAVVSFVGFKGGYGRVIKLKHEGGITTVYGHLSRFAKHLKKGQKVEQGSVIGYVGMSGLATGPHLHYEFLLNGKHRDPMKVALPKTQTITTKNKSKFLHHSRMLMTKISLLENTNIAALD